jgi:superfamily II DNA/RNA helicase
MLDMGFGVQLERIVKYLPQNRQTLMFSATLPANIIKISQKYLNNPERVSVGSLITAAPKIKQEIIHTSEAEKYPELVKQLNQRQGSIIVFVKTKWGAERLARRLYKEKHSADAIHGDLQQSRRKKVIQAFRDKKHRIMVATDVAARGLDIPHIEHVINYNLPQSPEDYIHRIGRTARAGAEGSAVCFISPDEAGKWKAIHRLMNPGEKNPDFDTKPESSKGRSSRFRSRRHRGRWNKQARTAA